MVWLASSDGGHAHRLRPGPRPALAPNGSLVAASGAIGLMLYPASGGASRGYFDVADATVVAAGFSPDSRYLAVVLSGTDPASAAASGLGVLDAMTFASRIFASGQIFGTSFAPDGSNRVMYTPPPPLPPPVDVHVIDADGSWPARLTHDRRSPNPVWGRPRFAFDRGRLRVNAEPTYLVWWMAGDGTAARQLTALAVPPLREALVSIDLSDTGTRPLAGGGPAILVAHGSEPGWNA